MILSVRKASSGWPLPKRLTDLGLSGRTFGDVILVIDTDVLKSSTRQQRGAECESVDVELSCGRDCSLQLPSNVDPPLTLASPQIYSVVWTSGWDNDGMEYVCHNITVFKSHKKQVIATYTMIIFNSRNCYTYDLSALR